MTAEPRQTVASQYPCPGRCGSWVPDGNIACLPCWYRTNPIPAAVADARHLPADHPRRAPA